MLQYTCQSWSSSDNGCCSKLVWLQFSWLCWSKPTCFLFSAGGEVPHPQKMSPFFQSRLSRATTCVWPPHHHICLTPLASVIRHFTLIGPFVFMSMACQCTIGWSLVKAGSKFTQVLDFQLDPNICCGPLVSWLSLMFLTKTESF